VASEAEETAGVSVDLLERVRELQRIVAAYRLD